MSDSNDLLGRPAACGWGAAHTDVARRRPTPGRLEFTRGDDDSMEQAAPKPAADRLLQGAAFAAAL